VTGRLPNFFADVAAGLATFFFPSRCRACGADLEGGGPRLLCEQCRRVFAAPLSAAWRDGCLLHAGETPEYARLPYDGPAGAAVRLLKFGGHRRMAPLLAGAVAPLAAELARAYELDVAVPVPLHPRRRRERRFNQAEEIGSRLAAGAGLDFRPWGLARVRYTRPQVELEPEERLANVRGAFAARELFAGRRALLVDDVITTGATVRECAGELRRAGAAAVVCCAAAGGGIIPADEKAER